MAITMVVCNYINVMQLCETFPSCQYKINGPVSGLNWNLPIELYGSIEMHLLIYVVTAGGLSRCLNQHLGTVCLNTFARQTIHNCPRDTFI